MVDHEARRRAARLVRQFRDGKITNDDLNDSWPDSREDQALRAVSTMLWAFYSDLREHRLEERNALTPEGRQFFDRCALFLDSDYEYEWPKHNFITIGGLGPWFRVLTLGLSSFADRWIERRNGRIQAELEAAGDYDVWPFLRRDDYDSALQIAATEG